MILNIQYIKSHVENRYKMSHLIGLIISNFLLEYVVFLMKYVIFSSESEGGGGGEGGGEAVAAPQLSTVRT